LRYEAANSDIYGAVLDLSVNDMLIFVNIKIINVRYDIFDI